MLLEQYDENRDAVINPDMLVERIPDFPEVTVSCFSHTLFHTMLEFLEVDITMPFCEIHSAAGSFPVYEILYKGKRFAFFQSLVGEPLCVGNYEDLMGMGSKRLILFGNCGVLDKNIEDCGIIIPTRAIRDEGLSYHYAPPSDMIDVNHKYVDLFADVLEEHGYPHIKGITWTMDACYRETRDKVNLRKEMGAVCVEMECAGMQAVCDFRGTEFFQFLYAGDNLDHSNWEPRSLSGSVRLDDKSKIALLAFELGVRIMEQIAE